MEIAIAHNIADGSAVVLTPQERVRHTYAIGTTGSGKSTVLGNMAIADMEAGHPVVVIDPHGALAHQVLNATPTSRINDVVYLDCSDPEFMVGYNPLVTTTHKQLTAQSLTKGIVDLWYPSGSTPRLDWFLYNILMGVMDSPHPSFLKVPRAFYRPGYRTEMIENLTDPAIKEFWREEYPAYSDKDRKDAMGPITNKIGQFNGNPTIRRIVSQEAPMLDWDTCIAKNRIVVVNLAKGLIGEDAANLLGSLMISQLRVAIMALKEPKLISVIVDEFQSFGTTTFVPMLSELRKQGLMLTLANQFTDQISDTVMAAILGNVATTIAFSLGVDDARRIAPAFHPTPSTEFLDLPPFHAWIKRRLHQTAKPIITTPPYRSDRKRFEKVRERSRRQFGRPL